MCEGQRTVLGCQLSPARCGIELGLPGLCVKSLYPLSHLSGPTKMSEAISAVLLQDHLTSTYLFSVSVSPQFSMLPFTQEEVLKASNSTSLCGPFLPFLSSLDMVSPFRRWQ